MNRKALEIINDRLKRWHILDMDSPGRGKTVIATQIRGEGQGHLLAASPAMLDAREKNDVIIYKHMGAIEAGEYSFSVITDILVEIQNNCRAAIAKAEGRGL